MMKSELASSKLSHCNLGNAMVGSNPLILKNEEEEEEDDGDSVSSKLDMHFSKDDVIDDDDFANFNSLKQQDRHHVSRVKAENYQTLEDCNDTWKQSSLSQEIKGANACIGSGDMIYSLLSILGTHNKDDMSKTLYAMSTSPESCVAMRQSGCLPLLIHLLHNSESDSNYFNIRNRSAIALRNIVNVHCEDQRGRQESRVLRLLEQLRDYCDHLRASMLYDNCSTDQNYFRGFLVDVQNPVGAVTALMKLTFDEEHRHTVCTLGGIQALAELLQLQQEIFGHSLDPDHITMRRYTCMALTNLTFGDGTNKALLCSMPGPLRSLVLQLQSVSEDLCQVASSVLRNLSWHADAASKRNLRAAGAVQMLTKTMLTVKKEPTLKSLLSALWNFSAHCTENKEDICAIQGALQLLVWSLNFRSPSKTLAVNENGGGVLRNVSSHVAVRPDYRNILRKHGCLSMLLKHLRSPSLTVVSNACGTLWNLSAHCTEDQKILCSLGAIEMLKNLVHSKHKMISLGSAAALRNLLSSSAFVSLNRAVSNPYGSLTSSWMSRTDGGYDCNGLDRPGLHVRRQRALQRELQSRCLSETCDTSSPLYSPVASPQSHEIAQPFSRSLQTKASVNFPSTKPPPYPVNFSDVVCHSDSDVLKSKILSNYANGNSNQIDNMSLEHDKMDELFALEDNFYSPGMFLSCHESIATGGQDTAADFLTCNSQNIDRDLSVAGDLEWANFYDNGVLNHVAHAPPPYFGDLSTMQNRQTVQDLEEEMIRLTVNNDGEIVDMSRIANEQERMPIHQTQHHHHHHHQFLLNPNMYAFQNMQGNNMLGPPIVFEELSRAEQIFNPHDSKTHDKNEILSFQFNPVAEVPLAWEDDDRNYPTSAVISNKKPNYDDSNRQSSFNKPRKSFLRQPTNYNIAKPDLNLAKRANGDDAQTERLFDAHVSCEPAEQLSEENVFVQNDYECMPEKSSPLDSRLTMEHELALQENANLVLSVLERTSLTESNLSSDIHLLEHETISLISDNETIDDLPAMLGSVPFFDNADAESSHTFATEHTFNMTSSIASDDETPSISVVGSEVKGKPRIVKPSSVSKPVSQILDKEDNNEGKAIRGRRKALYTGKPKVAVTTDKRVVSSSPLRNAPSGYQKDDKKPKISNPSNASAKIQTQTKGSNNSNKDKVTKIKDDKKVSKITSSISRPQSAFIRNTGSSAAAADEVNKQAKLKSHSLPPGQKPPTAKDCHSFGLQKQKPKQLSKQDTFVKLTKPGMNSSNDNLQKQEQRQSSRPAYRGKPRKMQSKIQNSGSSLEPSASSNEKIASVSSSNTYGKHSNQGNMSKSGSINSISSSRCGTSASKVLQRPNSALKQNVKKTVTHEDVPIKSSIDQKNKSTVTDAQTRQEALSTRLQKSSTYDKLKEFFGEESVQESDNANGDNFEAKHGNIESDSLEKANKEKYDCRSQNYVSKIPNISKKHMQEKRASPPTKEFPPRPSNTLISEGRALNDSDTKECNAKYKCRETDGIELDVASIKTKASSALPSKSKPLWNSSSKSTRKEISIMNAKNLSKTLPLENCSKIPLNDDDHQAKIKQRPNRGFSFWKKQPSKSKEEETQDQGRPPPPTSILVPISKKAANKSKVTPKAESPIRKKVLGWFKKGSDTHTIIAEKNKLLAEKGDMPSDFNFNRSLIATEFLGVEESPVGENLISTLDARNANTSPIRAAVVQPYNYHNLDGLNVLQAPDSINIQTPPKLTKTELLLARHRRSRLTSDSRSSMAMSIDSLKVNSIDSFQNTDCSFSDVPSEAMEKDDTSLSENGPAIIPV